LQEASQQTLSSGSSFSLFARSDPPRFARLRNEPQQRTRRR